MEMLFAVKYFAQKQLFWIQWPLEAKPLTLGQIWRNLSDGSLILFRMPFSDLP